MITALFISVALFNSDSSLNSAHSVAPLPESNAPTIEYASVAAAKNALRAKRGVIFKVENGWDIAVDEAALTIWSFAPPDYPAYPAVVKRQAVAHGQVSKLVMSVHCEASKVACDDLVRTFAEMNGLGTAK